VKVRVRLDEFVDIFRLIGEHAKQRLPVAALSRDPLRRQAFLDEKLPTYNSSARRVS
jgi:hypothetical protein